MPKLISPWKTFLSISVNQNFECAFAPNAAFTLGPKIIFFFAIISLLWQSVYSTFLAPVASKF